MPNTKILVEESICLRQVGILSCNSMKQHAKETQWSNRSCIPRTPFPGVIWMASFFQKWTEIKPQKHYLTFPPLPAASTWRTLGPGFIRSYILSLPWPLLSMLEESPMLVYFTQYIARTRIIMKDVCPWTAQNPAARLLGIRRISGTVHHSEVHSFSLSSVTA